jgi:nitroreductase
MNEVLKTIHERYTARSFANAADLADLRAIAEAGNAAPSAYNQQKWQLVVLTDADLIGELEAEALENLRKNAATAASYERIMSRGGKLFYGARAVIFVAIPEGDDDLVASVMRDCGIVVQNMALAAHSLGLGNCICGLAGVAFNGEKADYFKQKLGINEGYGFGISLLVGEADLTSERGRPRTRELDASKIVYV